MFRKLVSNLAFSPALVGQLGFYAKRLKKEEATRRVGLIFTVLALVMQSFAVFSPPEAANASNPSDFIYGGFSNVGDFLHHYDANTNNIKDLFAVMGITRSDISATHNGQINSKDGYYSWGLTPHFSYAQGERSYTVATSSNASRTFYARPLTLWDTGNNVNSGSFYDVLIGKATGKGTASGQWFALMFRCGNLVLKVVPPAPKCPDGQIGDYPDCRTPKCPDGQIGDYPDCHTPKCPSGTTGTYPNCVKIPVCPVKSDILQNNPECQPCPGDTSLWYKDKKCVATIVQTKSAKNITQGNIKADTATAKAGDKITYTLNIKNSGKASTSITAVENLSDVLEYATVVDNGGGSFNATTKTLSWPKATVESNQTISRMFTVQMLDTIPAMGRGISDKTSYDCRIDNTFGNAVQINVDCPVQKVAVEQTVEQLPHTGPRENLIFAGITLAIVTYFYARSRQIKKEVRLVRRDFNAGTI